MGSPRGAAFVRWWMEWGWMSIREQQAESAPRGPLPSMASMPPAMTEGMGMGAGCSAASRGLRRSGSSG
jgi:hypothetical protein